MAAQKRPLGPITFDKDSKRSREESGAPRTPPSKEEEDFDKLIRFHVSQMVSDDAPPDKLGAEDLAKMLQVMRSNEIPYFGTTKMPDKYLDIEHCRKAISDINPLVDALRDAHHRKSYYRIRSMGKCSPISESAYLTPY